MKSQELMPESALSFVPKEFRNRLIYLGRLLDGRDSFLLLADPEKMSIVIPYPIASITRHTQNGMSVWIGQWWDSCPTSGDLGWVIERLDEKWKKASQST